jgi:outer membrane protein TolC
MIPAEISLLPPVDVDLESVAEFALSRRTEIDEAFAQIRDAAIRENVAKNEILPKLDLILEGYLAGLKGKGDFMGAFDRQNKDDVPGLAIGFRLEFPFENNAATARLRQQRLLTRQRFNALRLTIETVLLETKVAVREVKTSARDVEAKYETVVAASNDLRNLLARRSLILGFDEVSAINYIEYFLDSQDRESRAQEALIQTVTNYRVSLLTLERVKGNLLNYEDMVRIKKGPDRLPALILDPPKPMLRASVPLRNP